jgi:hypothetical protein
MVLIDIPSELVSEPFAEIDTGMGVDIVFEFLIEPASLGNILTDSGIFTFRRDR